MYTAADMNGNIFLIGVVRSLTFLAFFIPSITEATLISSWTEDGGTAAISGATTTTVTLGNGGHDSAAGVSVSGSLSGNATLAAVGDMIQTTGTFTLTGVNNGNAGGDLMWGLFNTNGSSNANGWLGINASNSDSSHTGFIFERTSGNTTLYSSSASGGTGATQLTTTLATGNPSISDGTYTFSLTLTRLAGNQISIAYTLNRTSSAGYTLSGSFTDTAPVNFTFNKVGFYAGSNLKADQFVISNTDVTFTAIPEPGSMGLLTAGALGLVIRRRR